MESSSGVRSTGFCPEKMDSSVKTCCAFLEFHRADITRIAMATLAIVKAFDVIENIGSRFVSDEASNSVDTLQFHDPKKLSTTALS